MTVGFAVGGVISAIVAAMMTMQNGRYSTVGTFDLCVALGGIGAYLGHAFGATTKPRAGHDPLTLTSGVFMAGFMIVMLGSVLISFGGLFLKRMGEY